MFWVIVMLEVNHQSRLRVMEATELWRTVSAAEIFLQPSSGLCLATILSLTSAVHVAKTPPTP